MNASIMRCLMVPIVMPRCHIFCRFLPFRLSNAVWLVSEPRWMTKKRWKVNSTCKHWWRKWRSCFLFFGGGEVCIGSSLFVVRFWAITWWSCFCVAGQEQEERREKAEEAGGILNVYDMQWNIHLLLQGHASFPMLSSFLHRLREMIILDMIL